MNARKALDMLETNRIEELKEVLRNELYTETLKEKPGAKKRYAAMKKYFTYHKSERACLQKPGRIEYEGKNYISFTNSWSLVLTTEDCGEIELFNESDGTYPDIKHLLRFDGIKKKIDFTKVIAEAKRKGYRFNKREVGNAFHYVMSYDGAYYKIGLLEASLSLIDNGSVMMTYHPDGDRMPLTIQNELGICVIMPVKFYMGDPEQSERIVIEVE